MKQFKQFMTTIALFGVLFSSGARADDSVDRSCCVKPCCKKPLKLRVVSKNMLFGWDAGSSLTEEEGFDPPLPTPLFLEFPPPFGGFTEEFILRSFENLWQQANNPDLVTSGPRLDAMAIELAAQDADIICLQEVALIANNPLLNPDGTPRFTLYQLGDGYYGNENSPDDKRYYNYATMLVERLKKNHGQEFIIAQFVLNDGMESRRSLNTIEDATAFLSFFFCNAVLVRKKLKAKILRNDTNKFFYAKRGLPGTFIKGADPNGQETFLADFTFSWRRSYGVLDLDICGQGVRVINTHLPSFVNIIMEQEGVFEPADTKYFNDGPANTVDALQLVTQEVITSPHPTILCGDLNAEPLDAPFRRQDIFPRTTWGTLVGSVAPDGQILNSGGVMVDSGQEVLGPNRFDPQYATILVFPLGQPFWEKSRNPLASHILFLDHILFRDGDGVQAVDYNVTQPTPLPQTPEQPFAWTSDHNGIFAELLIPRCGCKFKKHTVKNVPIKSINRNVPDNMRLIYAYDFIEKPIARLEKLGRLNEVPAEVLAIRDALHNGHAPSLEDLRIFKEWYTSLFA